jgi:hypothetical protein
MPSSAIRTFSYDDVSHTLFVTFVDGDLYAYLNVEPKIYGEMQAAPSKGRFFAYKVRNRYRCRKLPHPNDRHPGLGLEEPADPGPSSDSS